MSELSGRYENARAEATSYTAALMGLLGDREPLGILTETPSAVQQAIGDLSVAQQGTPERQGKWSIRQVVQHLADAELVGSFRFRMVLTHDAPELPGYDQDRWATRLHYEDSDIDVALGDFRRLREANVRLLRRATPDDLRRVMRHSERGEESLAHMMRMYAGHDLLHRRQIQRIREAIGA
jgi:uncharacterized damage-inducible protein DinB